MPLWNITPRLTRLTFTTITGDLIEQLFGRSARVEEQSEETFTSVDVPAPAPFANRAAYVSYQMALLCRTLIAAARGGNLKHLECCRSFQCAFAIRSLLPCWINVEEWGYTDCITHGWLDAAATLRPFLAHASLWLGTTSGSGARQDRYLTAQELQSLQSYFKEQGGTPTPRWEQPQDSHQPSVWRYLPWLAEDAHLAGEVAEAWNAVVRRGEADRLKCNCRRCAEHIKEDCSRCARDCNHSREASRVKG